MLFIVIFILLNEAELSGQYNKTALRVFTQLKKQTKLKCTGIYNPNNNTLIIIKLTDLNKLWTIDWIENLANFQQLFLQTCALGVFLKNNYLNF